MPIDACSQSDFTIQRAAGSVPSAAGAVTGGRPGGKGPSQAGVGRPSARMRSLAISLCEVARTASVGAPVKPIRRWSSSAGTRWIRRPVPSSDSTKLNARSGRSSASRARSAARSSVQGSGRAWWPRRSSAAPTASTWTSTSCSSGASAPETALWRMAMRMLSGGRWARGGGGRPIP